MKFDDIPFLMKNISDEMPLHSENTASVPHKYGNLPKDIMKESHKKDNKFLNNHLHEIEEAVDKNFIDKNSFIKQQVTYHKESGVLNHDNIFHADLATGTPIGKDNFFHYPFLINSFISFPTASYGAELNTTDTGTGGQSGDRIFISKTGSDGVAGELYNRIAYRNASGTGEMVLGVYDQQSSVPTNLTATTATDLALDTSYTWQDLTEFALETNEVWLAVNRNASGTSGEGNTASRYKNSITGNGLPDPVGTGWTTGGTQTRTQKLGHSSA